MTNLIDDLSILTSLSKSTLNDIALMAESAICHSMVESTLNFEDYAEIQIGIGTLYIKNCEDGLHYKFIPSDHLDSSLQNSIKYKRSTLNKRADETLIKRIKKTYKEML